MSKFNFDGHKLQHHPERVYAWQQGKDFSPINVEISPVGNCNNRCVFCNYNYLGHKGRFPEGALLTLVEQLAESGVKAVIFAGAGEPSLHPDTFKAMEKSRNLGLDVAMSTNGSLLKPDDLACIAKNLTWIRFSVNGTDPENYGLIHGTKADDYDKVVANITALGALKAQLRSSLTIGVQLVLLPQNMEHVLAHAERMKGAGVDYFVIKHFYEHEKNAFTVDSGSISPAFLEDLGRQAKLLSDKSFSFIVRDRAPLDRNRPYSTCEGLPFIYYISENGDVYSCFSHQEDKRTCLGNVLENTFAAVCASSQKREAMAYIQQRIDKNRCQANCRHHQLNLYLWHLAHPQQHVNFI